MAVNGGRYEGIQLSELCVGVYVYEQSMTPIFLKYMYNKTRQSGCYEEVPSMHDTFRNFKNISISFI